MESSNFSILPTFTVDWLVITQECSNPAEIFEVSRAPQIDGKMRTNTEIQ